ncbi:hypothetical protein D3C72_2098190 [compost metagenome]
MPITTASDTSPAIATATGPAVRATARAAGPAPVAAACSGSMLCRLGMSVAVPGQRLHCDLCMLRLQNHPEK